MEERKDIISRQEAIDALKEQADAMSTWTAERYKQQSRGIRTAINILEDLPSAQPEQIARDIATIIENEKDMRVILKNAQPDKKEE